MSPTRQVDAVQLSGLPAEGGAAGERRGGTGGADEAVKSNPHLRKQVSETEDSFADRCHFVAQNLGVPRSDEEALRHAALSMAWANHRHLGCRYPAEVERALGITGRAGVSGMAVRGELRSRQQAQPAR